MEHCAYAKFTLASHNARLSVVAVFHQAGLSTPVSGS